MRTIAIEIVGYLIGLALPMILAWLYCWANEFRPVLRATHWMQHRCWADWHAIPSGRLCLKCGRKAHLPDPKDLRSMRQLKREERARLLLASHSEVDEYVDTSVQQRNSTHGDS